MSNDNNDRAFINVLQELLDSAFNLEKERLADLARELLESHFQALAPKEEEEEPSQPDHDRLVGYRFFDKVPTIVPCLCCGRTIMQQWENWAGKGTFFIELDEAVSVHFGCSYGSGHDQAHLKAYMCDECVTQKLEAGYIIEMISILEDPEEYE